ncbi:hypothetical protein MM221_12040 [Salipaludibacillus sp. LMS25]|jgi:hypothetical protein|uniref:hypothetical protein n=1 Tax=Salipaludibacillus sp. LMS25 TaxID=2924031 RepID=UPI0020D162EC|nr:hypothetical protein [Salipaludibacillus sp. LMS25]UTR13375.1 hypothetical protein MM221_12040 [Salipaludibacillus sp. LMS25]
MNNKTSNFEDVPVGKNISYEHLMFYLEQGREIEFLYQKKEYFISNSLEGRTVWMGKTRLSEYFSDRDKEFVDTVKINGITLKQLFQNENEDVEITTIF